MSWQEFKITKDKIEIVHAEDSRDYEEYAYQVRQENDLEQVRHRARRGRMNMIGAVPVIELLRMSPEERELFFSDDKFAKEWLRRHPQYRTSGGRF